MGKWIQTSDFKVKRKDVALSIGDYIDYHDRAGENGKDLYYGRWQVLGSDDMGNLLILSEENVTTHYFNKRLTLEGAMKAYSTGVDTLNKICEVYAKGKGAVSARSICIEDVDKLTGFDKTTNSNYGKSYTLKNQKGNTFIWHDGIKWHKTKSNKSVTSTNTYYGYAIGQNNLPSNVYDMLFGGEDKYYWLASSYASVYSRYACFGLRLVVGDAVDGSDFAYSDGDYISRSNGVRTVVTLKSDINITQKQFSVTK